MAWTAVVRRSGRAWKKPVAEFGESVHHRPAVATAVASGMQPTLYVGRYLGHHARTGSILIMTTEGVVKAAGFRRMNEENRWNVENWNALRGPLWDVIETGAEAASQERQDVEMPVEAPVESAFVKRGSDAVADNEERARLRPRAEGKRGQKHDMQDVLDPQAKMRARLEPRRGQKLESTQLVVDLEEEVTSTIQGGSSSSADVPVDSCGHEREF